MECAAVSLERLTYSVSCVVSGRSSKLSSTSSSSKRRARIRRTHAKKCLEAQLGICKLLWSLGETDGAANPGLGECPRAHTLNGSLNAADRNDNQSAGADGPGLGECLRVQTQNGSDVVAGEAADPGLGECLRAHTQNGSLFPDDSTGSQSVGANSPQSKSEEGCPRQAPERQATAPDGLSSMDDFWQYCRTINRTDPLSSCEPKPFFSDSVKRIE